MLEKLSKLLIFSSIFLTDYRILNIPITTCIFILCSILIFLFYKNSSIRPFFLKDIIKKLLLVILTLTVFTYFLKSGNMEQIKQIYYNNSGFKPDHLYLKMVLNGIIFIMTAFLSFSIGLAYKGDDEVIKRIIKFLINLITINALINIFAWVIQTGGIIGRYNFNLPISSSFGINIQWSILGFILQLSNINWKRKISIQTVKLAILFLSILIIVSRQNQLMFIIIILVYLYLTSKKSINYKAIAFSIFLISCISYIGIKVMNFTAIETYRTMFDPKGDDILVRYQILVSALNIFKENILIGVGYGMFGGYNSTSVAITSANVYLDSPHNGLIAILTEMGVLGLFLICTLAFHIIRRINSVRKHQFSTNPNSRKYISAVFAFIYINIFVALISNYFLFPPPSEYSYYGIASISWLLIGILISHEHKHTT